MPSMDGEPWPPCGATRTRTGVRTLRATLSVWARALQTRRFAGVCDSQAGRVGGGGTLARENVKIASHTPKSLMHLGQGERLSSSMKGQVATPRTAVKSKFATVSESKGTSFERPAPQRMQCYTYVERVAVGAKVGCGSASSRWRC